MCEKRTEWGGAMVDGTNDAFLFFLVREKLISESQAELVREIRTKARMQFGKIAVKMGILTVKQVAHILQYQATNRHLPFGKCAVFMGYMRTPQIKEVIREQVSSVPSVRAVLIEQMIIGEGVLRDAHETFRANRGFVNEV